MTLSTIEFIPVSLKQYAEIDPVNHERILEYKERISGRRIVHVNSTRNGGGVAKLLSSHIPLANGYGVKSLWYRMEEVVKNPEFYTFTKCLHAGLQGREDTILSKEGIEIYFAENIRFAEEFSSLIDCDFCVVHDPQPLLLRDFLSGDGMKWIWRAHLDMTSPNPVVYDFLKGQIESYDARIFTFPSAVSVGNGRNCLISPAIDPFSEINRELSESEVSRALTDNEINPEKPIITQVGRYDQHKNPIEAIDTYRKVKEKIPEVQLVLAGQFACDDPEGGYVYRRVKSYATRDDDVFLLSDIKDTVPEKYEIEERRCRDKIKDREINSVQRASDVVLQLSLREGFALSITEALWKRKPVVASSVGGIPLQVKEEPQEMQNGCLVDIYSKDAVQNAADKIVYLLRNPDESKRLGENGHQLVKRNFLITRLLSNYLELLSQL